MQKINKSKLSIIKIICMCFIFILLSGIGVMAVTTKLNSVTIKFNDGKEMVVLTSKNTVKDILDENNIVLSENEKISPDLEENITETKEISISNKSNQEVEIAKLSESGVNTPLDSLLEVYNEITEKIETVEESIPFETITKDVSDGAESTKNQVLQEGQEGIRRVSYKVKYQNDTEIERIKISEEVIKEPVNKIIQVKSNIVTSRSDVPARAESSAKVATTGTVAEYQAYAKQRVYDYGWTDADFNALVNLWNRESGWQVSNRNRSSGAYGIPQALPASKMASAGSDYLTNYKTQINWGLSYIKTRYGSPSKAWSAFKSKGWY